MFTDPKLYIVIAIVSISIFRLGLLISKPDKARISRKDTPTDTEGLAIYRASFQERAQEAARIVQACLSKERYEAEDDLTTAFAVQQTKDGISIPGAHLWGRDDEILVFPADVTALIHRLLAPTTDPADYQPFEPTYPTDPEIEERIHLSVNPHELSQAELLRISRTYAITAPRLSQLALCEPS